MQPDSSVFKMEVLSDQQIGWCCIDPLNWHDLSETVLSRILTTSSKYRSIMHLRVFVHPLDKGGGSDKNQIRLPSAAGDLAKREVTIFFLPFLVTKFT